MKIGLPSPEEKIFKVFTIYGHGGYLGHVTWTIYTNFCSPIPMSLHIKFDLIGQMVFEEKMFEIVDDDDDHDHDERWSMGIL